MTHVTRCNPALADNQRILNQFFSGNLHSDLGSFIQNNESAPAVNIKESVNDFRVEVVAPGFTNQELNIEVDKGVLTISAKKENQEVKETTFNRREFSPTSFKRSFRLPENKVDESKISANYEAGILHIVIAKLETAKPKPKQVIEIA
ncbi:MAG: Hsp20/alpha crystallin family protein [Marinilabiliaceae bacterium]|nr:Hsp20/alpha crystallin family protein [Marinilabiliaceae bacterium]